MTYGMAPAAPYTLAFYLIYRSRASNNSLHVGWLLDCTLFVPIGSFYSYLKSCTLERVTDYKDDLDLLVCLVKI